MFNLNTAGYMISEKNESEIYRPYGSGDWLFLYFPCSMKFYGEYGAEECSKKDACVIYAPDDRQWFGGNPNFCNSFVHFECTCDEMSKFSFETGKIFYSANAAKMNRIIKKIKEESMNNSVFSQDMLSAYITQLVVTAERSFNEEKDEQKKDFVRLRYEMLENYEKNYSAAELAARVCMSKSRFYEKYKMYFNKSPKQEIIKIRMETAKALLTNENESVASVAQKVGFESTEHFSRYFKKYFGNPPKNRTKHQI